MKRPVLQLPNYLSVWDSPKYMSSRGVGRNGLRPITPQKRNKNQSRVRNGLAFWGVQIIFGALCYNLINIISNKVKWRWIMKKMTLAFMLSLIVLASFVSAQAQITVVGQNNPAVDI